MIRDKLVIDVAVFNQHARYRVVKPYVGTRYNGEVQVGDGCAFCFSRICYNNFNVGIALLVFFKSPKQNWMTPRGVGTCDKETIGKLNILIRSEEHTSELQSRENLVCRLLLEKKKK